MARSVREAQQDAANLERSDLMIDGSHRGALGARSISEFHLRLPTQVGEPNRRHLGETMASRVSADQRTPLVDELLA